MKVPQHPQMPRVRKLAVSALVIFTAACGSDHDSGAPASSALNSAVVNSAVTGSAVAADGCSDVVPRVTMGKVSSPTGLDPTLGIGGYIAGSEMAAMYDTLMLFDPESREYVPNVAESLTLGEDGETWTLVLRPGVTFTNGDVLSSSVVLQNLERTMASTRSHATQLKFIDTMTIVDELTLTLHSDKPTVVPPLLSTDSGMMINPTFFGDSDTLNAGPPAGSTLGPFLFGSWLEGEELILKRNPSYWGGEVCVEQLKFDYLTTPDALLDAYQLGEIDVAQFRNAADAIAEVKDAGAKGFSLISGGTRALVFNARPGSPTAEPRLRRAIAMAIDYPLLLERVNGGLGEASGTLYPESSWLNGGPGVEYDVEGATSLVEELRAEGADLSIEFVVQDNAVWSEAGIALEAMLENVGLEITIVREPTASITERIYVTQDFEMISWAITANEDLPGVYVGNALRNAGLTDNANMNEAVDALFTTKTPEELQDSFVKVQTLWNELLPEVVLTHDETFTAVPDDLVGVVMSSEAKVVFAGASRK